MDSLSLHHTFDPCLVPASSISILSLLIVNINAVFTHICDFSQIPAEFLAEGEVVAFPTETVYGLGANALSSEVYQLSNLSVHNHNFILAITVPAADTAVAKSNIILFTFMRAPSILFHHPCRNILMLILT